jgi:hypothetical protein
MLIVKITVEGGVIQHVAVPEGVSVIVRDYDVDDLPPEVLQRDEQGSEFIETVWTQVK